MTEIILNNQSKHCHSMSKLHIAVWKFCGAPWCWGMVAEESFQNMVWAMLHGLAHSLQLMEISLSLISIFPASRFLTSRKMFLGNEVVDLCQAQLELRPPPRHQHLLQPDLHGGTNALSVIAPELAIKRPESHAMPWPADQPNMCMGSWTLGSMV